MMRVGVYGGTFDPVHNAHLRLARALRDELTLDRVHLIPAGRPYHRPHGTHASPAQRLAMLTLALESEARLYPDPREVTRDKNAYTVDTLTEIRAEIGSESELWCLIGSDSLAQLASWHRWTAIFTLANLAVAIRPGFDAATLPPEIGRHWAHRQVHDFSNRKPCGTIRALTLEPHALSATEIRQRLASGQDVSTLLPPVVRAYIAQQGLYR